MFTQASLVRGAYITLMVAAFAGFFISTEAHASTTWMVDNAIVCDDNTIDSSLIPFCTIGAAIATSTAGDTVSVSAGTYAEQLTISHSLTLQGANAGTPGFGSRGAETIIDGSNTDAPIAVRSSNVVINGLQIQNGSNPAFVGYMSGIWIEDGHSDISVLDSVITGNGFGIWADCAGNCLVQDNLFDANNATNAPGNASISADSTTGLTIDSNKFQNEAAGNALLLQGGAGSHNTLIVTDNIFESSNANSAVYVIGINDGTFSGNTISPAAGKTGLYLDGGHTNLQITNNTITGGAYGVRIDDFYAVGTNSNIVVNENNITGASTYLVEIISSYSGALDAVHNYWGMTDEAAITALMFGDVDFTPYYSDSGRTTYYSAPSVANPTVTITASDTATSSITVPADVTNPKIDFSSLVSGNAVTIPGAIIVDAQSGVGGVDFSFLNGTVITSSGTWDGIFDLPAATTTYAAPSGGQVVTAIGLGLGDTPITLSNAARISFDGQDGKLVGWSQGGNFTAITTTCSADDQGTVDAQLTGPIVDCVISTNGQLVVWTKHLTSFVVYTTTVVSSGNGGGGNGAPVGSLPGGGSSGGAVLGASTGPGQSPLVTTPVPTTPVSTGEVLGSVAFQFTMNLGYGTRNDDVAELQKALVAKGYSIPWAVTTYFGPQTLAAVKAYQKDMGIIQTGFVGPLTRAELNK